MPVLTFYSIADGFQGLFSPSVLYNTVSFTVACKKILCCIFKQFKNNSDDQDSSLDTHLQNLLYFSKPSQIHSI